MIEFLDDVPLAIKQMRNDIIRKPNRKNATIAKKWGTTEVNVQKEREWLILRGFLSAKKPTLDNTNQMGDFIHCALCLDELPDDVSPEEWGRLSIGWSPLGLQVWCVRHNCNVVHMDFQGHKHPEVGTRRNAVRLIRDILLMEGDPLKTTPEQLRGKPKS